MSKKIYIQKYLNFVIVFCRSANDSFMKLMHFKNSLNERKLLKLFSIDLFILKILINCDLQLFQYPIYFFSATHKPYYTTQLYLISISAKVASSLYFQSMFKCMPSFVLSNSNILPVLNQISCSSSKSVYFFRKY